MIKFDVKSIVFWFSWIECLQILLAIRGKGRVKKSGEEEIIFKKKSFVSNQ